MMDEYKCKKCKGIWEFFPEDYEYNQEDYPTICPMCEMPLRQLIKDSYNMGGLREVFYQLRIRL